jgi:hypothetical protein
MLSVGLISPGFSASGGADPPTLGTLGRLDPLTLGTLGRLDPLTLGTLGRLDPLTLGTLCPPKPTDCSSLPGHCRVQRWVVGSANKPTNRTSWLLQQSGCCLSSCQTY